MYSYFYLSCEKARPLQNISPEFKDFVGIWFPCSPSLSHTDQRCYEDPVHSVPEVPEDVIQPSNPVSAKASPEANEQRNPTA